MTILLVESLLEVAKPTRLIARRRTGRLDGGALCVKQTRERERVSYISALTGETGMLD